MAVRSSLENLPLDSIALFETSVPSTRIDAGYSMGMMALVAFTTLSGAVTMVCLTDPKACFGSCPTLHVAGPEGEELVAEGFSASIARVLEARDVDALPGVSAHAGTFEFIMRNEALETHAVR